MFETLDEANPDACEDPCLQLRRLLPHSPVRDRYLLWYKVRGTMQAVEIITLS